MEEKRVISEASLANLKPIQPGEIRNPEGRPKDTPLKKAAKQLIAEYKEALAEALPMLSPVLIKQAMRGDVPAIKELHDRAMGRPPQHTTFDGEIRLPKPIDDVRQNAGLQEDKNSNETG